MTNIADAFAKYHASQTKDYLADPANGIIPNSKEYWKAYYEGLISSQPMSSIVSRIKENKPYDENGDKINQYLAPIISTRDTATSAIGSIARQTSANLNRFDKNKPYVSKEITCTFIDKTTDGNKKAVQFVFKHIPPQKEGEQKITPQNDDAKNHFEEQFNNFCQGGNFNKGMAYGALTSDAGLNRLVREISGAKTGLRTDGFESAIFTIEKMDNDVLKITLSSRPNAVIKLNKEGTFKVDYNVSVLLYPDGHQQVEQKDVNYEKKSPILKFHRIATSEIPSEFHRGANPRISRSMNIH